MGSRWVAGTDHKSYYSLDGEEQPFTTLIDMTLPKGRVARHQLLYYMSAAPPCMSSPLIIIYSTLDMLYLCVYFYFLSLSLAKKKIIKY